MSIRSINLSSRNLIDNQENNGETQTELKEDVDLGERGGMHETMEHPGSWDDVLTVSVEEELRPTTAVTHTAKMINRINVLPYCLKHLLMVCCLVVSLLTVLASFLVLHIYSNKISKRGHNLFEILQHIGGYSFAGGVACLLSFKLAFHSRFPLRVKMRRTRVMKGILRKYLMTEIFDMVFLKQFLRRAQSNELTDQSQLLVSFINSSTFNDWIAHRFRNIHDSPEGIILDSLGIDETELETYFKVFATDLLVKLEKIYLNNKNDANQSFDFHKMKRYVESITLEKLSNGEIDTKFRHMVGSMVDMYLDDIVCCVIALMAIVGLIVGCIRAFS